jgi:hypothetical protein
MYQTVARLGGVAWLNLLAWEDHMAGLIGRALMAAGVALSLGGSALAADMAKGGMDGVTIYSVEAEFEDVRFALENAIINRGLVIDYTSHIGEMLARTGPTMWGQQKHDLMPTPRRCCSARRMLSRKVMEADPLNIAYCPYTVFVYDTPDAEGIDHTSASAVCPKPDQMRRKPRSVTSTHCWTPLRKKLCPSNGAEGKADHSVFAD